MNYIDIDRLRNLSASIVEVARLAEYAQEASVALAPQKKAIADAAKEVLISGHENVNVPCFLPASLVLKLAAEGGSSGAVGVIKGVTVL